MKEIYLDNSATTRCLPDAAEVMKKVLTEDFGNPSSLHNKGVDAELYLKHTRQVIAESLHAKEKEICFTSGGSESNNTAILGACDMYRRNGKHVITTSIEHAAVEMPMTYLEQNGYEVTRLSVDSKGRIDLDELKDSIRDDTVLVSIMQVNNEIGTVEPVEAAAKIIHEKNNKTLFHVDAIQSYGKIPINPGKAGIDMLSVSGHKIHGPKGSGFLYVRDGVRVRPLIFGGGQEGALRSGTENVPAIAGLGEAVSFITKEKHLEKIGRLRKTFVDAISGIDGVSVNGPETPYDGVKDPAVEELVAPYIVSVSVHNVRAEVLLHALEERGIYVSAGSACSSNRPSISRTLKAIGLDTDLLDSTVRFSMSVFTTEEELLAAAEAMKELIPTLQKYRRY